MTNVESGGKLSLVLLVAPWVKFTMYSVCLVPVAFAAWAVWRQTLMPDGGLLVAGLVGLAVIGAFSWLFRGLYKLCSIRIDPTGISQSFLFQGGNLMTHVDVTWDQVQSASFSRHSYTFTITNGPTLELNTALFGDVAMTIHTMREILPPRLLAQVDAVRR